MKRLADLSARELSALLRVSVEEAREYLESASSTPFMQVSVGQVRDDIRHLQESGELDPKVPPDVVSRWIQVRALLFREPEFETRYPAAYRLLLEPHYQEIGHELIGIFLPSFGVHILQHAPEAQGPSVSRNDRHNDAFSSRIPGREGWRARPPWPIRITPGSIRATYGGCCWTSLAGTNTGNGYTLGTAILNFRTESAPRTGQWCVLPTCGSPSIWILTSSRRA